MQSMYSSQSHTTKQRRGRSTFPTFLKSTQTSIYNHDDVFRTVLGQLLVIAKRRACKLIASKIK